MADQTEIKNMLERLEMVEESAVSSYKNRDGYSYTNDHSPLGIDQAIKKSHPIRRLWWEDHPVQRPHPGQVAGAFKGRIGGLSHRKRYLLRPWLDRSRLIRN